jgi:hypothetical protein
MVLIAEKFYEARGIFFSNDDKNIGRNAHVLFYASEDGVTVPKLYFALPYLLHKIDVL